MSPVGGSHPRTRRTLHEAAHKLELKAGQDIAARALTERPPVQKRVFNEASHKLGYWAPPTPDNGEIESEATRKRFEALADHNRDVIAHAGRALVAAAAVAVTTAVVYPLAQIAPVVALGVVYLLAVLLVSSFWGGWLGVATALASTLAFNFFHIPPTGRSRSPRARTGSRWRSSSSPRSSAALGDLLVMGHSQRGQSALFTGQFATCYSPELHLVGVAAGGPVPNLIGLFNVNASPKDFMQVSSAVFMSPPPEGLGCRVQPRGGRPPPRSRAVRRRTALRPGPQSSPAACRQAVLPAPR
jgi:Domain of unknown function (DUF4118)